MPVETFDSGPADVGLAGDRYDKLKAHFKVRYGYLQEMRRPFEIMWQQVDDSILPYRYSVSNEAEQFNDITINKKIFDGETINASMTAANSFVAAVAPQGVPYFQSIPDREEFNEDFNVAADRERYCKYHESVLIHALEDSNWYEELVSFVKKGFDYGTTAMYAVDDEDGDTVYCTLGKKSFYIDEGPHGQIDTLWRELWMQNRHILTEFPNISQQTKDRLQRNPYTKTRILHIVEPRTDYDPASQLAIKKRWGAYYVIPSMRFEILDESGFDEFPYFVWRQYKEPGIVWGFGSGINCIRAGYVLQAMGRTVIDFANQSVDPAYALPKSVEGEEELFAGGRMFIDPNDAAGIVEIGRGGQYPIGTDIQNKMRESVGKFYFIPEFRVMNSARMNGAAVDYTATEVDQLKAEALATLSSITASFNSSVMDEALEDQTNRCLKSGKLKPFETLGLTADLYGKGVTGFNVSFDYIGPMAMAQQVFHRISGAEKTLQKILPASKFKPSILDNWDEDEYYRLIAEANNALGIMVDPKKRDAGRQARAQAQAAQYQAQMGLEQAKIQAQMPQQDPSQQPIQQGAPATQGPM